MKKRGGDSFKTGPAISDEEAQRLASLMRHAEWPYFADYLERIRTMAFKKRMRLGQGREVSGYYKGVYNLANDLINLPEDLGKQIFTKDDKQGEDNEIESL